MGGGACLTEDGKDAAPEDINPKCRARCAPEDINLPIMYRNAITQEAKARGSWVGENSLGYTV